MLATYRVLPQDGSVFREWARLMHRKSDTLTTDALIAATAVVHRLTVVTRNVRDFEFGVPSTRSLPAIGESGLEAGMLSIPVCREDWPRSKPV